MIWRDLAYQAGIGRRFRLHEEGLSARCLPCSFTPIRITSRRFVSSRERAKCCGVRAGRERKEERGRDVLSVGGIGANTDDFCVQDEGTSWAYMAGL